MLDQLFAPANLPFSVALGVVVALALLEVLTLVLGFALSSVIDSALDLDHGIDIHADFDHDGVPDAPVVMQALDWFNVGAVPLMILLIIGAAGFGMTGLTIQSISGNAFNPWIVCIPAFLGGLAAVKLCGGVAKKFVFREFTEAVSNDSMLGSQATITIGGTQKGHPTQAKLKDKFGQTHYVLVEPLRDLDTFELGATVILVQREGHKYFVVEDSMDTLLSLGPEDLSTEHRQKA